ncbi:MAG TPA: alpha/beta fold hydrolase [Flavobacterium sp.]|nr:alpha/beta fold hydrolase [Flavobacterium sp.]
MSLYHLIRKPSTPKDKNPLLLLLHGYGSNEEDLFSFAGELPQDAYVVSARAPYSTGYGGFAWYTIYFDRGPEKFSDENEARDSRDRIVAFLDELLSQHPIDPDDVTLIGFSQGSILSHAVALSYPAKIRRVAALSGYLNTALMTGDFEQQSFDHLQFFLSHGSVDQVIPVDWARQAKPALDQLGVANEYREYPVGHGVAPQNFFDLRDWLERTRK